MFEDQFWRDIRALHQNDERHRSFVPLRVWLGDDSGLGYAIEGDNMVFKVYRRNPLPTRFNQNLGSVGDNQIFLGIDFGNVAGDQPAIVEFFRLRVVKVFGRDPGAAN